MWNKYLICSCFHNFTWRESTQDLATAVLIIIIISTYLNSGEYFQIRYLRPFSGFQAHSLDLTSRYKALLKQNLTHLDLHWRASNVSCFAEIPSQNYWISKRIILRIMRVYYDTKIYGRGRTDSVWNITKCTHIVSWCGKTIPSYKTHFTTASRVFVFWV